MSTLAPTSTPAPPTTLAPLFQEGTIGNLRLKNRLVQSPMHSRFATEFGEVDDRLIAYLEARARGGVGMIILENTAVDWVYGRAAGNPVRIDDDVFVTGLHDLVQAIHRHGVKIATQLHHAGRQNLSANIVGGLAPLAPSPIQSKVGGDPPKEMTLEDIERVIDEFRQGARRTRQAGFDAVEIHGCHGYILTQFLSPATNQRSDEWGGSFENRARFGLEVVKAVREAVGDDFPVLFRVSLEERTDGGLTAEEGLAFCKLIEPYVDLLDVSAGIYESMEWIFTMQGTEPGSLLPLARMVKDVVGVPVMAISRLGWILEDAARAVESGEIDFVAMGRTQLADPEIVNKTRRGETKRVRRCIACNECVGGFLFKGWRTQCVINPELGIEYRLPELKRSVLQPKRVLVVGGGISGCEAAKVAAERHHEVTLIEKDNRLGGLLWGQGAPEFKRRELDTLIAFYEAELEYRGVDVRLGVEATEDLESEYDVVLLATGTEPVEVPEGMLEAVSVLCTRELPPGDPVTIVGSSHYGSHAAAFALEQGRKTRFVPEPGLEVQLEDINPLLAGQILDYLMRRGIEFLDEPASLDEIDPAGGIVLWAPHDRRPSSVLAHLVDGDRVREVGTRTDPHGGLYVATQSGFYAGAGI
jgi:2,4-dienoyl-CoA reductase-like NADH-dependent reductase (Old Yellow Enzyme family)